MPQERFAGSTPLRHAVCATQDFTLVSLVSSVSFVVKNVVEGS